MKTEISEFGFVIFFTLLGIWEGGVTKKDEAIMRSLKNKQTLKLEDNTDIWDIIGLVIYTSFHFPSMPS